MDVGAWLLLVFFGWLAWLAIRRYNRSNQLHDGPKTKENVHSEDLDGDSEWGNLHIADTPRFLNERSAALAAPPVYEIEYFDADGVITTRFVTPSSWRGNEVRTNMWCHLRQDWRTFRYDRIHKIVDLASREVLQPEQLRAILLGRAAAKDSSSGATVRHSVAFDEDAQECWETYADVLTLLAFIAKADGRFVAKERAVVRAFILDHGHTDRTADMLLKRLTRIEVPGPRAIDKLLQRIAIEASDSLRAEVPSLCRAIASADAKIGPDEQALLARVDAALAA